MTMIVSIICLTLNLIAGCWIWFRVGKQNAIIDSMIKELERATQQIVCCDLLIDEYKRRVTKLKAENEQLQKAISEYKSEEKEASL